MVECVVSDANEQEYEAQTRVNWFDSSPGGILFERNPKSQLLSPVGCCLATAVSMAHKPLSSSSEEPEIGRKALLDSVFVSLCPTSASGWVALCKWGIDSNADLLLGNRSERASGSSRSVSTLFWKLFKENFESKFGLALPDPAVKRLAIGFALLDHRAICRSASDQQIKLICGWTLPDCRLLTPEQVVSELKWQILEGEASYCAVNDNPLRCCGSISITPSALSVSLAPRYVSIALGTDFSQLGSLNFSADLDERQALLIIRFGYAALWLQYFPEWKSEIEPLESAYAQMCIEFQVVLDLAWDRIGEERPKLSQPATDDVEWSSLSGATAGLVSKHWFRAIVFAALRDRHFSVREYLATCDDKTWNATFAKFKHKAGIKPIL